MRVMHVPRVYITRSPHMWDTCVTHTQQTQKRVETLLACTHVEDATHTTHVCKNLHTCVPKI